MRAGDRRAAVQAGRGFVRCRHDVRARLVDPPLALQAPAEAFRGRGPQSRRLVLEVMVERGQALDAIAHAPALALAGRGLGRLDRGPEEAGAGEDLAHVAGQPGVVVRDDVGVELALDFVDDVGGHGAARDERRAILAHAVAARDREDYAWISGRGDQECEVGRKKSVARRPAMPRCRRVPRRAGRSAGSMTPLRISIVEDHPVLRDVLQEFIGRLPGVEIGKVWASAEAALEELDDSHVRT